MYCLHVHTMEYTYNYTPSFRLHFLRSQIFIIFYSFIKNKKSEDTTK